MIFKNGDEQTKICFLQEHHLSVLRSAKLDITELQNLAHFDNVSDEDALDWLSFQRAIEKFYTGNKITTYSKSGVLKPANKLDKIVFNTNYLKMLDENIKPILGNKYYGYHTQGVLYILISDNTVNDTRFTELPVGIARSVYQGLLYNLGMLKFYFRDLNLNYTLVKGYISPGFVVSKCLK